jgi:YggT family protein
LLAAAVLYLLIKYKAVDAQAPTVAHLNTLLQNVTEPTRRPIRRILPNLGDVDISPIVVIVFVRYMLSMYVAPLVS